MAQIYSRTIQVTISTLLPDNSKAQPEFFPDGIEETLSSVVSELVDGTNLNGVIVEVKRDKEHDGRGSKVLLER